MLKNYGFTDEDCADGGSDQLKNAVVPTGPAAAAAIRAHLDAGADHVVAQPIGPTGAFDLTQLSELADAVGDLLKR
jgi:hypothetical protein